MNRKGGNPMKQIGTYRFHFVLPTALLLLLLGCCPPFCPGPPKCAPEIKTFYVVPQNTCAANPGQITVGWSTDATSVSIDVLGENNQQVKPTISGLDPSLEYILPPAFIPKDPGEYKIRLTAEKSGCEHKTTDAKPLRLVGDAGVWIDFSFYDKCLPDVSECFNLAPFNTEVREELVSSSLLFSHARLNSFSCTGGTCTDVKPNTFQICRNNQCMPFCSAGGCDFNRAMDVPRAWAENPYGQYLNMASVTGKPLKKNETAYINYSFHFVCR
jgi:hypothetical protein